MAKSSSDWKPTDGIADSDDFRRFLAQQRTFILKLNKDHRLPLVRAAIYAADILYTGGAAALCTLNHTAQGEAVYSVEDLEPCVEEFLEAYRKPFQGEVMPFRSVPKSSNGVAQKELSRHDPASFPYPWKVQDLQARLSELEEDIRNETAKTKAEDNDKRDVTEMDLKTSFIYPESIAST
ncbi:MAG: hypothetical protein M1814_002819 [Vezdaea aestivalis]|nr:MAG: hypothetical protein M1814_002819 [Vezdaea aestivalis]